MKLSDIYRTAVEMGMNADPRGREAAQKELDKAAKAYEKLEEEEQEFFDMASLENPYGDSRLLYGDPDKEIHKLFCGIDLEVGEINLIENLNRRGAAIDLALAHHPEGEGLANLGKVMQVQPGVIRKTGVLPNVAEALLDERIVEVERSVHSANHFRAVDAARLLDLPMMCVHTPADNLAASFLTELLEAEAPETVGDIVKLLKEIPEYHYSAVHNLPPLLVSGASGRSAGKIFVDFTGGTSGPKEMMQKLSDAGVSTVVAMHATEGMVKIAKEAKLNLLIAGHMASDSLGLNLFLDELACAGVEIVAGSGLIRWQRKTA
ncbi:MAG: NGG1p interacting factor NIF3 [Firmicutes bacterium]|nr:NGG1p interacting factor NIF3 [Bacillota bacterium]